MRPICVTVGCFLITVSWNCGIIYLPAYLLIYLSGERAVRHSRAQNRPGPEQLLGHWQLPFPFPSYLTEGLRLPALSSQMSGLAIAFSHKRPSPYLEASSFKSARCRGGTASLPRKFLDPKSEPAASLLLGTRTKARLTGFGTVRCPRVHPRAPFTGTGCLPVQVCLSGCAGLGPPPSQRSTGSRFQTCPLSLLLGTVLPALRRFFEKSGACAVRCGGLTPAPRLRPPGLYFAPGCLL